jgi:hypothetical protein
VKDQVCVGEIERQDKDRERREGKGEKGLGG